MSAKNSVDRGLQLPGAHSRDSQALRNACQASRRVAVRSAHCSGKGRWMDNVFVEQLARRSLTLRPAHAHSHLVVTALSGGFRHFVASMPAPVASGWSVWPGGPFTHWKTPPFHGARGTQPPRTYLAPSGCLGERNPLLQRLSSAKRQKIRHTKHYQLSAFKIRSQRSPIAFSTSSSIG
jgi:hypothetical protein